MIAAVLEAIEPASMDAAKGAAEPCRSASTEMMLLP
jgi:hypothetical protein